MLSNLWRGAMAGAAGTTVLNAVTYLDMVGRSRPASDTPQEAAEATADALHIDIPGTSDEVENRASAIGALMGIATGIGVGVAYGAARGLGFRPPWWSGAMLTAAAAMAGSDVPMARLGVTDPKDWSTVDWASDIVPHLAYGIVTAVLVDDL